MRTAPKAAPVHRTGVLRQVRGSDAVFSLVLIFSAMPLSIFDGEAELQVKV
jgi:hypothetical protein